MQYPRNDIELNQNNRAGRSSLVDKCRAAVIGQVAPRPFYNYCANTWSTPCQQGVRSWKGLQAMLVPDQTCELLFPGLPRVFSLVPRALTDLSREQRAQSNVSYACLQWNLTSLRHSL